MNSFRFTVSSPDGSLFSEEVECVTLRGIEGELAIMAGHTPFITSLVPGICRIDVREGDTRLGHTEGGLLVVTAEGTRLLASDFRWQTND